VRLLGFNGHVAWQQAAEGLIVTLPTQLVSPYTCALQITGTDLRPVPVPVETIIVSPDAQGNLTCAAAEPELHGDQIQVENQGGQPNAGFWDRAEEWVSWKIKVDQPGSFLVSASCATVHSNAEFVIELADQQLTGKPVQTGGWADFKTLELGRIRIEQPGLQVLKVRARDVRTWKAINLRWVKLVQTR
jgi:alpha-L-fucosidase